MKSVLCIVLSGLFVSSLTCSPLWAQATAQISGSARDQSGAVLPGVEITVTQTDTGTTRTTITNETGSYVLPNLPIGPHRLEAVLPGFRMYVQTGIVLQVGSSPAINVVLEVGQLAETVEVLAQAAQVETRSVGVAAVVENTRILELPLDGRVAGQLIALSGAAVGDIGTAAPSVAGGLNTGLNFTLDGGNHNNPYDNTSMNQPFPDALEEFRLETSATSASTGVRPAGGVHMVTKSGTNQFRGSLFHFVRNYLFNSRNPFAGKRDSLKRNQFGGVLGGPVVRNKVFFFGGYQGTTLRSDPPERFTFVPTAAMRAGDFTEFASPACNRGRQINLRAPFVNNRVDPARFSPAAVALLDKLKMPVAADPCGRINYSTPSAPNEHQVVGRIDYEYSSRHRVFGRYLGEFQYEPSAYGISKDPLSLGTDNQTRDHQFTVGLTSTYGPNVVNGIRLTGNRVGGRGETHDSFFSWRDLGVNMTPIIPDALAIEISGGFVLDPRSPRFLRVALFGINDDVSIVRGNHQVTFGANLARWYTTRISAQGAVGRALFEGDRTGLGLADFMTGQLTVWNMANINAHHKRSNYVGSYFGDAWRVTPTLTLQLGLRWEPFFPMDHIDGTAVHFNEDALRRGLRSKRFDHSPRGTFYIGDPEMPGEAGMYRQWWNFSPRIGLAWDVTGDGRTSVRASVGTFYDYLPTQYHVGLATQAPWSYKVLVDAPMLDNPWATYPGGDPFPVSSGRDAPRDIPFPLFSTTTAMEPDSANPRVTHWNLVFERQVSDWIVSASYLGNLTRHLWGTQPINHPIYVPGVGDANGNCFLNGQVLRLAVRPGAACSAAGNIDQRRRFMLDRSIPLDTAQMYGAVNKVETGGTASYNGLVLSVRRRVPGGVTIAANHTWSHCISDWVNDRASGGEGNDTWVDPDNRHYDRGNCVRERQDRRHVFNLTAVVPSPNFSSPALRALGSGWRLSTIFRALSGAYTHVESGQDRALTRVRFQRADQVLPNIYGDKSINDYLNPAAFAQPELGTLGNHGRGSFSGPGTWQLDMAVVRTFRFHETQSLELRAEAFNVTNSFRMGNLETVLRRGNFGQITAARDPRIMQFALKYHF